MWYKGTHLEHFIKSGQTINDLWIVEQRHFLESVLNVTEPFLSMADKGFRFNNIATLLSNGRRFFESLPITVTYEGFCNLIESIFNSRDVNITINNDGSLNIVVINYNEKLVAYYIVRDEQYYVGYDSEEKVKRYVGFKSGEWTSLTGFLKRFLQQFLPAGHIIRQFNLLTNPKETQAA